ncbi:hypothetical protein QQX98_010694 [Neonectria punicea]|uniref:Siderophore iron transporter mirB n=1 Tax=Neonectria punicea TaxID=979145 RepID=A0ABR1GNR5_9HYPO
MAAPTQEVPQPVSATRLSIEPDMEKHAATEINAEVHDTEHDDQKTDSDADSATFQPGVERVRTITSVWSKKTLWLMFALLYLVSFVDTLLVSVQGSLNPYITSSFQKHGLLASVSVVATIVSGCSKLTLAKIIDIWGRIEGFLCMLLLVVISLIMKATCKNMETYVGAHTLYWSIKHYFMEFDASPHTPPNGWKSGYIIAMEVLGFLCIPVFHIWELKYSPVQFLPWKYLKEPTIIGSSAGTHTLALICMILGTALLIPFRQPDTHVGVLTLVQVLNGLGTGILAACGQLAVMSPVTHQQIAVVVALWGMFGSIGAAVGYAIAGALWNNILPKELYSRLPEESKNMTATIFGDLAVQISYLDGTPEREVIVGAYAVVQKKMVIAGCCFVPLCLASIYVWRNINVKKMEVEKGTQTKGTVW